MSKHNALTTFGRSGNPMFRGEAFKPDATFAETEASGRMTLAGTVNKTGILLVLCLVTASFTLEHIFRYRGSSCRQRISLDRTSTV